jgi:hypothetical protein
MKSLSEANKEQLRYVLTDAFLTRQHLQNKKL